MCTNKNFTRRCDLMLFDYRTTYRTDFRDGQILPTQEPTVPLRPKPVKKQQEYHLTDTQTVTKYKNPNFPFDLMAVPKEIIRTYCLNKQQPFEKLPDQDFEEARTKRPKVVMVPAACIDDIEDPKKRQLILQETYTTTWDKASRLVHNMYDNSRFNAPLKDCVNTNPFPFMHGDMHAHMYHLTLQLALGKRIEHSYVHPEFRWRSMSWEREQLRSNCDPTVEFWKRRLIGKQK